MPAQYPRWNGYPGQIVLLQAKAPLYPERPPAMEQSDQRGMTTRALAKFWNRLFQQFKTLRAKLGNHLGHTGNVSPRSGYAFYKAGPNGISKRNHDNWNRAGCSLRGLSRGSRTHGDNIRLEPQTF